MINDALICRVRDRLLAESRTLGQVTSLELRGWARDRIRTLIDESDPPVADLPGREAFAQIVLTDLFGYGPLEDLMADDTISEIMVNRPDEIYIERHGVLVQTDKRFSDEAHLRHTIARMIAPSGRSLNDLSPFVDVRLPDGSRLNAIIPPLSLDGPVVTIRKFLPALLAAADLLANGTLDRAAHDYLRDSVANRRNVLIAGGTDSGKTTMLNALSSFIPDGERVVTIEDAAELRLRNSHVIRLETRSVPNRPAATVTVRDLVRNALRMRPDRLIVGECRGGEALDMLQAMNTGHEGCMTTLHANTARDALSRLETMALMSGVELPLGALRHQVRSAIHVIVHMKRDDDGRRRIDTVSELSPPDGSDGYELKTVFDWGGQHANG